jgi:hypothetical protein
MEWQCSAIFKIKFGWRAFRRYELIILVGKVTGEESLVERSRGKLAAQGALGRTGMQKATTKPERVFVYG